ncbi:MAG: helix-turn-helix transcriptional regulator [Lachnospiraceae bacterium]|nr:helix-turn-helix transcriptional regulator [Lachnospiraceae bacterium]
MNTMEYKEYSFSNPVGETKLKVYQIFPGVELVYSSVHMDSYDLGDYQDGVIDNLIEIHHCREGRVEQVYDDEVFYLSPGDLAVAIRRETNRSYSFPTNHYHGCTVMIDTTRAPKCFSEFLEDVRVQPMEVAKRLCGPRNSFYIRKQQYIEHIFSELYTVPENRKKGYLKVKILELLLILSMIDPDRNEAPARALPKSQMFLAKQSAEYLTTHMDEHITIPELAKEFSVSETTLKNAFKAVYGVPVYSYIRMQKMQMAAQQLIHSDLAVADIAYDLGYKNTSKFADAFRGIMGETPSEFRERNRR